MIRIKLSYAIKEKKQNTKQTWYDSEADVFDVTGDLNTLIVRVVSVENELRGIWVENNNGKWTCLQEDVDNRMVDVLMTNQKVKSHLKILEN